MTNTQIGVTKETHTKLFLEKGAEPDCLWQLNQIQSAGGAYSCVSDLLNFTKMVIEIPIA